MATLTPYEEDAVRAILHTWEAGNFDLPAPTPTLIIGPYYPMLATRLNHVSYLSPFAAQDAAWQTVNAAPYVEGVPISAVILFVPQQKDEALALLAKGLSVLTSGGLFIAVAPNDMGGKTLHKTLASFGVAVQDFSKHKCRVVWTTQPQAASPETLQKFMEGGASRLRNDGLWTIPGVFSWNHRDQGTHVLLDFLDEMAPTSPLSGHGADFGCGIGEMGYHLLPRHPTITSLLCFDHDRRAIQSAAKNLAPYGARVMTTWQDITTLPLKNQLDFIVMNPPFHQGKFEHHGLGHIFIEKAAAALKKSGTLYLVANAHLPYEDHLKGLFSSVVSLGAKNGFKVIKAKR